jgi:Domain of unknown function (DUF6398)
MYRRSTSQSVPKNMQVRFDELTQLTDAFCRTYLNEEYADLCRQLTAALCRKRPSPLERGNAATWASGIVHTVGSVNFLFDRSQTPYIPASQIAEYFGLGGSTVQSKSKQIRDLLHIRMMDPQWTLPSRIATNPMVWMLQVDGIIIDARYAPREIQVEAYLRGIIPYIPGDEPPGQ